MSIGCVSLCGPLLTPAMRLRRVDAPIVYQPDPDFQSFDGLAMQTESWLEIPLKADRQLPITCAVSPSPHAVRNFESH